MRRVWLAALAIVGLLALPASGDICYKKCGSLGGGGGSSGSLRTFVEDDAPVDGSDECNTGDEWFVTAGGSPAGAHYICEDGATDDWTRITAV